MRACMLKFALPLYILVAFEPLAFCQIQLIERWELQNTNINLRSWAIVGIGNDGSCVISSDLSAPDFTNASDWHDLWIDTYGNVIRTFSTNDFPGFYDGNLLSVSSNALVFWNEGTNAYSQFNQGPTNTYIEIYTNSAGLKTEFYFPNVLSISTLPVQSAYFVPHPDKPPTDFLVTAKGEKLICYKLAGVPGMSPLTILLGNGSASVIASGVSGQTVSLQSSSNLVNWSNRSTVTNAPDTIRWESNATAGMELYRTLSSL
jgi:hypothetical protein